MNVILNGRKNWPIIVLVLVLLLFCGSLFWVGAFNPFLRLTGIPTVEPPNPEATKALKEQQYGQVEAEGLQTTTNCSVTDIDEFDTEIIVDWTDGAPNMSWVDLILVSGYPNPILIQGEAGHSIDIIANVKGVSWHLIGEPLAINCFAEERVSNDEVYRLYVGTNEAPAGWTKAFPPGVEMKTFDYFAHEGISEPIAAGTADTYNVELGSHQISNANLWINGQFWNPNSGPTAYHFVVYPGYTLNSPPMQGTYWAWTTIYDQVQFFLRLQQTVVEVQYRDADASGQPPVIIKFYCGPRSQGPEGWLPTMPDNWECTAP